MEKLAAIYQPWMRLDGEIPFYARVSTGSARCTFIRARSTTSTTVWPRPSACSSGRCCKKDRADAWSHYMAYTKQGGSRTFTELLKKRRPDHAV